MEEHKRYEEDTELPHPWEWVIITLFSASIVVFGLLVYRIVPEGPRHWDFGQLPDTPAESIYSTEVPGRIEKVPRQFPKLPEAQPLNRTVPSGDQLRERGPQ